MLSSAFFFFIAVTIIAYGVQGSLQTVFARRYDVFGVVLYRNLSLGVTMMPVLFFVPFSETLAVREHLGTLALAGSTGAFSLLCALLSSRYLPLGIATAIRQMSQITVAVLLGALFLGEYLTVIQFILLTSIVFVGIVLVLLRPNHSHLDPAMLWRGIGLTFVAGGVVACSFYFFSVLSRAINPIAAGYFWETSVGVFALLYFLILVALGKHSGRFDIPARDAWGIVSVALITIVGTVSYAFAVNYGPYALAAGLLTMTILVASGMGWLVYQERLTRFQGALIILAIGLMFLLKMVS